MSSSFTAQCPGIAHTFIVLVESIGSLQHMPILALFRSILVRTVISHCRRISMLTGRPASRLAHLRSHSSDNAGVVLSHAPTAPEYTVPLHFSACSCWSAWDSLCQSLGLDALDVTNSSIREAATLPLVHEQGGCANGPLQPNGCREAGARVRYNAFLGHERSCSPPTVSAASRS